MLVRGDHGIGKSQSVYQLASHFKLDMVERRLSQMSEGDMIGLPKLEGGVTKFMPPDWYMRACTEPVCLFLDEINRATPEVMQAAFQIVLDRTLNGHKLHEGTRIYAAINTNGKYQINEMDPALLDRFWTVDLDPSADDWFEWASKKIAAKDSTGKEIERQRIHPTLFDFLKKHQTVLFTAKASSASDVTPSPRSWERLDTIFRTADNLLDKDIRDDLSYEQRAYSLSVGMVGLETARTLVAYLKTLDRQITALDILDNFDKVKNKVESLGQEKWNICIDKVADHLRTFAATKQQGENLQKFIKVLPDELIIHFWTQIVQSSDDNTMRDKNISVLKDYIVPDVIRVCQPTVDAMKEELEKKK